MSAVYPAYASAKSRTTFARSVMGLSEETKSRETWLDTGKLPSFEVTMDTAAADAAGVAKMWLRHPAYKMTLASVQKGVDADGDGLIDREEFKKLLEASGYTGTEANALFAKIDKDGSGGLTQAEIKFLSQGKAGHVASG